MHFHIVPRAADLPAAERGPAVFRHLAVPVERRVDAEQRDELAASLAGHLR